MGPKMWGPNTGPALELPLSCELRRPLHPIYILKPCLKPEVDELVLVSTTIICVIFIIYDEEQN